MARAIVVTRLHSVERSSSVPPNGAGAPCDRLGLRVFRFLELEWNMRLLRVGEIGHHEVGVEVSTYPSEFVHLACAIAVRGWPVRHEQSAGVQVSLALRDLVRRVHDGLSLNRCSRRNLLDIPSAASHR